MAIDDETIRLILDMGASGKNVDDVRQKLDSLGEAAEETGRKVESHKAKMSEFSRTVQGLGRAIQDFVQGGVGGVLNNIEQVFAKFPMFGAVVTGVASVLYAAWTPLTNWFKAWRDGVNEIPAHASKIKSLNDELKTTSDRLEEVQEKGFLTDDERSAFLDDLDRQAKLEREIANEKERQATFDRAKKADESRGASKETADLAEHIINTQMGGVEKAIGKIGSLFANRSLRGGELERLANQEIDVANQRQATRDAGQDTIMVDGPGGQKYYVDANRYYDAEAGKVAAARDAEIKRIGDAAASLIERALKGDAGAATDIGLLGPEFAKQWYPATKSGIAEADQYEAESEAFAERARAGSKARRANKAEAEAEQKADKWWEDNQREIANRLVAYEDDARRKQADALKKFQAPFDDLTAKAQGQYELRAEDRFVSGGFTDDEGGTLADSFAMEAKAAKGQVSLVDIEAQLQANEDAMNSISSDGGFGSEAYQAFLDTSAMLMKATMRLRAIEMQQRQFDMQFQQGRSTIRTGLDQGW